MMAAERQTADPTARRSTARYPPPRRYRVMVIGRPRAPAV
jgi:hypothetical protein